jgi:hypothetical protein
LTKKTFYENQRKAKKNQREQGIIFRKKIWEEKKELFYWVEQI